MLIADDVMLLVCLGLTLLGVLFTALAGRRGNRGRVVQGLALTLAPVGLYLSGLLGLLWRGVTALGNWATALTMSRTVWVGLSLLAVCLVLWLVGGVVARRAPRSKRRPVADSASPRSATPAVSGADHRRQAKPSTGAANSKASPPVDDDMAEIEELLKSRGIN